MKIGITERGDASIDLSWKDKIDKIDGAIIISKGYNDKFENCLLENKNKIIYHCTCTTLGGTIVEPNVISYLEMENNIKCLIEKGFDPKHIVIRIDPIVGTNIYSQIKNFPFEVKSNVISQCRYYETIREMILFYVKLGIRRFRYSYLDLYPHVIKRFEDIGFQCPKYPLSFDVDDKNMIEGDYSYIQRMFSEIEYNVTFEDLNGFKQQKMAYFPKYNDPNVVTIHFESCSEDLVEEHHKIGCISKRDFEILGLDIDKCIGNSYQRPLCLCCSAKTELLNNKTRCQHSCVYCYWK